MPHGKKMGRKMNSVRSEIRQNALIAAVNSFHWLSCAGTSPQVRKRFVRNRNVFSVKIVITLRSTRKWSSLACLLPCISGVIVARSVTRAKSANPSPGTIFYEDFEGANSKGNFNHDEFHSTQVRNEHASN